MASDAECLIIGGGPAGLTAALYLGCFRRRVVLVDGGLSRASWIPTTHNLIGFRQGISGLELLDHMREQASLHGVRWLRGNVEALSLKDGAFHATIADKTAGGFIAQQTNARFTGAQGEKPMSGSVENPEHEAERPAPIQRESTKPPAGRGPNAQGNDRGERKQDREGQQGGTHGGSKKQR